MSIVPLTGIVRKYYEDAAEDIEYRPSAFWQVWLQREFATTLEELDMYAVTSEFSPDSSRRRVDHNVKRYDRQHHTLSSLIWNECKRSSGSAAEAEAQALDASRRCIRNENLLWIYALTTVGTTFRVWRVWKRTLVLEPFPPDATQYVDADSRYAWVLREAIREIKTSFPLADPPILPSQSHLLGASGAGEEYGGTDEAHWPAPWSMAEDAAGPAQQEGSRPSLPLHGSGERQGSMPNIGQSLPSMTEPSESEYGQPEFSPAREGQISAQGAYHQDEAQESTWLGDPETQGSDPWVEVNVKKTPHMTSRDEFIFKTLKGHDKSTDRDEWEETSYRGKRVWSYRHKGTYYYTRKKLR